MKKKSLFWSLAAAAAAATAVTVYHTRKKNRGSHINGKKNNRHLTPAFAKAKGGASGEYTL